MRRFESVVSVLEWVRAMTAIVDQCGCTWGISGLGLPLKVPCEAHRVVREHDGWYLAMQATAPSVMPTVVGSEVVSRKMRVPTNKPSANRKQRRAIAQHVRKK